MTSIVVISDEPRRLEYTICRKLNAELVKVENSVIDIEEFKDKISNKIVLLRIYSPYKLITLSLICEKYAKKTINSSNIIIRSLIRELLYRELEENGIPIPRRIYIFDLCNVPDIADKVGKLNMLLTFTKSEIEGIVETAQAIVSLIEHRYYMSAEDVKVNLVIPKLEDVKTILVIGRETNYQSDTISRVIDIFGEGIYSIISAKQENREVIVSIDPVPLIEDEEDIEKVVNYLKDFMKNSRLM